MTGAGSDTASFMSAVDSQAPTPVASERLPVKVVTGNIAAEGGEFIAPTRTVQAQLLQVCVLCLSLHLSAILFCPHPPALGNIQ